MTLSTAALHDLSGASRARILVVDDEQAPITGGLPIRRAEVIKMRSASEAWRSIEECPERYSHVVVDVQLGGRIGGVQLTRLISALHPTITVVATAADGRLADQAQAHGIPFLAKPWHIRDVFTRLAA